LAAASLVINLDIVLTKRVACRRQPGILRPVVPDAEFGARQLIVFDRNGASEIVSADHDVRIVCGHLVTPNHQTRELAGIVVAAADLDAIGCALGRVAGTGEAFTAVDGDVVLDGDTAKLVICTPVG
jgi:hypothetical protein